MERVRVNPLVDWFLGIWRSKPDVNTKEEIQKKIESLEPGKVSRALNGAWNHIETTLEKGIYDIEPNNKIVDTIEVDNEKVLQRHANLKKKKLEGKERE